MVMIVASQATHPGSNPGIRIKIFGDEKVSEKTVKVGDRVELILINDTWTNLKPGDRGTVFKIDDGQELIWVNWDNGEQLALLVDGDKFKIIKKNK